MKQLGQHAQQRLEGRRAAGRGVGSVRDGAQSKPTGGSCVKTHSTRGEHRQTCVSRRHGWCSQNVLLSAPAPWLGHLPRSASPPALAAGLAAAAPAARGTAACGAEACEADQCCNSGLAASLQLVCISHGKSVPTPHHLWPRVPQQLHDQLPHQRARPVLQPWLQQPLHALQEGAWGGGVGPGAACEASQL